MSVTTNDLIKELQRNDPTGNLIVYFVAYGYEDEDSLIAGDAQSVSTDLKFAHQTSQGDKNVIRLHIHNIF